MSADRGGGGGPGFRPEVHHDRQSRPDRQMSEPSGVNSSPSGDRLTDEAPITRVVQICNKKGLHARASAKFVQLVEKFDADVRVKRGNEVVGGTSIMGLMMLAAGPGTSITIEASGNQAAEVIDALAAAVSGRVQEDEKSAAGWRAARGTRP